MEPCHALWLHVSSLTAIVFWIVHESIISKLCPRRMKEENNTYWWHWCLSTAIFGFVASVGAIYSIIYGPEDMFHRLSNKGDLAAYVTTSISFGFFVIDLIYVTGDMKLFYGIFSHHAVAIIAFGLSLFFQGKYLPIAVVFQLMEINNIFLNIQRVFNCLKIDASTSVVYRFNSALCLASCVVFRFLLSLSLIVFVVARRDTSESFVEFAILFFCSIFYLQLNWCMLLRAWKSRTWKKQKDSCVSHVRHSA